MSAEGGSSSFADMIRPGCYASLQKSANEEQYPTVKVRFADYDSIPSRALLHQKDTRDATKDFLTYDEIPGVTNFSRSHLNQGKKVNKHVHPSKYEIFEVLGGEGWFYVWEIGAEEDEEPKEKIKLKRGIVVTVGPREPHAIESLASSKEPLVMTYVGIVAPEEK